MDLVLDILLDAGRDTLALVPFLFVTYLVLELLEHAAGDRVNAAVRRAGAAGPAVGAVLGVVPQCGFSAMGATLYAGRVVTLGTLVAVFLSTSDEMLPIFVAERADAGILAQILLAKAAVAMATGVAVDAVLRALRRNARVHAALRRGVLGPASAPRAAAHAVPGAAGDGPDLVDELSEAGSGADRIHELCERDHCGCDAAHGEHAGHGEMSAHDEPGAHAPAAGHAHEHGGHGGSPVAAPVRSALSHTVQVTVFIFLVSFVLVSLLETVGEQALASFLSGNEALAVFASGLVGLVPNCAASVVITQLYLEGVLGFAPMMAGSLVSVGIGFLVLFRTNGSARENLAILLLLYIISCAWGLAFLAFGL